MVFDNEPFKAVINQMHERCSLDCNRVTSAESGSLLDTTKYVLTFIIHVNRVPYMMFSWGSGIICPLQAHIISSLCHTVC